MELDGWDGAWGWFGWVVHVGCLFPPSPFLSSFSCVMYCLGPGVGLDLGRLRPFPGVVAWCFCFLRTGNGLRWWKGVVCTWWLGGNLYGTASVHVGSQQGWDELQVIFFYWIFTSDGDILGLEMSGDRLLFIRYPGVMDRSLPHHSTTSCHKRIPTVGTTQCLFSLPRRLLYLVRSYQSLSTS